MVVRTFDSQGSARDDSNASFNTHNTRYKCWDDNNTMSQENACVNLVRKSPLEITKKKFGATYLKNVYGAVSPIGNDNICANRPTRLHATSLQQLQVQKFVVDKQSALGPTVT